MDFFGGLRKSLSQRRFEGYGTRGNDLDAFAKYLWNIQLCESLCPSFQLLEVAFRNRTHREIANVLKHRHWISSEHGFLYQDEKDAIAKSKQVISLSGTPITEDCLIAEMKFGFWTALLNSKYETLWLKIVKEVFPNMPNAVGTRDQLSS